MTIPRQIATGLDSANPIMQLTAINREFPAGEQTIQVLKDINLTIYEGDMVAIIGQSGSGKSTLMNILGCLDQASSGDYRIFGDSVEQLDADELAKLRREHFGFIFQSYHLLGDISALDNVAVPAVYAGMSTTARSNRAKQLLSDLGLADKVDNRPSQLSGGQQQRVSIARALMNGGDVILADEPTGALDSKSGADVMQILKDLNSQGHTVIMVTHDPTIAKQAKRVIEIKDGVIIADYLNTQSDTQTDAQVKVHPLTETSAEPSSKLSPSQSLPHLPSSNSPTFKDTSKGTIASFFDRITEAAKMSLFAMRAHKMRTLLTMLGIIIGIASVVSIVGLGQGTQQLILNEISSLGANTITVIDGYPRGDARRNYNHQNLTPDDAYAIESLPYVLSVSPQLRYNDSVQYNGKQESVQLNGVGKNYFKMESQEIAIGQGFDTQSISRRTPDIIIDQNTKNIFFKNIDNPIGEVMLIGNVPVQVIGVLAPNDGLFADFDTSPTVYMPYTAVMSRLRVTGYIDAFTALIELEVSPDIAENAITQLMQARHGTDDFEIQSSNAFSELFGNITKGFTVFISSIAVISLVVGGIGVMNIMLVSVTERTNEIGVRMAVGARQSDIMQQFLIEAVLVCILGGTIGVLFAFMIGSLVNLLDFAGLKVIFSTTSIIAAFVCSTMIGIIFGFLPARSAARLNPVEALARD